MIRTPFLAAAVAVAALAAPAPAAAPPLADDARCLLVSSFYARSVPDAAARQAAQTVAAFFLGRVDGRASPPALKAALAAARSSMSRPAMARAMNACEARMAKADRAIEALSPRTAPAAGPRQGR